MRIATLLGLNGAMLNSSLFLPAERIQARSSIAACRWLGLLM
jgi:hypothetical protein